MDVVYVVRPGANPELRYSLRSLVNLPHGAVWIVGHAPAWVRGCRVVPVDQRAEKWENVRRNWSALLADPGCPDTFMIMNDDMYVMRPVDELPVWHHGSLDAHAATASGVGYGPGLARTAALLRRTCTCTIDQRDQAAIDVESGCAAHRSSPTGPLSYELHIPMLVERTGWAAAIDAKWADNRIAPRSLYGNTAGLGGEYHPDVKVRTDADPIPDGPFLSTDEASFGPYLVGALIRDTFPAVGPYEAVRQ